MKRLEDKVALITGGGSGIGRATAIAFAREGTRVVAADMSSEGGEETVRLIRESGGEAFFVKADITQETDVRELVDKAVETYGRLDCACNNAGIEGDGGATADCTLDNWDQVMNVNLRGVFMCMKYEIPQMLRQGGGAIVNVASTMGIVATPQVPAYVASKHGVIGLTKSTALAYVKDGIRVNAICPGNTRTAIIERAMADHSAEFEALMAATPIGRLAEPVEIADTVVWLCSDAASYCNGHAMIIDGCYTTQ